MPDRPEVTEDALLGGAVRLRQPARGHRAGTDAVLLAAYAGARPGERVVDLGSGSGAVGLMVAARTGAVDLVLVERDPVAAALAAENLEPNGLAGSGRVLELDLFADPAEWPDLGSARGECDLAVTNPPFFDVQTTPSPEPGRRSAHEMRGGTLAGWYAASRRFLKPAGRIVTIGRADRLAEILDALGPSFGSFRISPTYPRVGEDASRVIVSGRLGGRGGSTVAPGLVLHEASGEFTETARRLHAAPS